MKQIKTLDELTKETYGLNAFAQLPTTEKIVIVKIQRNNIEIAKLELLDKKRESV